MPTPEVNVITGAFSYTGKYITRRLLAMEKEVRTLTEHHTHLSKWLEENVDSVGKKYASELNRHYLREKRS